MKTEIDKPDPLDPEIYATMYRDIILDPNKLHPEPYISSNPSHPSNKIEALYQANQSAWETLPAADIADSILDLVKADEKSTTKIQACYQSNKNSWNRTKSTARSIVNAFLKAL